MIPLQSNSSAEGRTARRFRTEIGDQGDTMNRALGRVLSTLRLARGRSTDRGGFGGSPCGEVVSKMERGWIPQRVFPAVASVVAGLHDGVPLTYAEFREVADAAGISMNTLVDEVERICRERVVPG